MVILIKGMDEIPEDGAVLVVRHDNGKAYIKHACTYGYSMELVKLPAAQPDHNADISKKADEDCISRQAAIELCDWYDNPSLHDDLEKLPPAQPEQKRGEWMFGFNNQYLEKYYYCSNCGCRKYREDEPSDYFCLNCGADMRGGDNT